MNQEAGVKKSNIPGRWNEIWTDPLLELDRFIICRKSEIFLAVNSKSVYLHLVGVGEGGGESDELIGRNLNTGKTKAYFSVRWSD